jgi:hypothetical protein
MLYDADDAAKLWVDLGADGEGRDAWPTILSRNGVQQGCTFGSFLACLGLQPQLEEVAATMTDGAVLAYMDDVKVMGPVDEAKAAYAALVGLCADRLGIEEVPSKGSVVWAGPGAPDLAGLPPAMPGVATRVLFDKALGVYIQDGRQESEAAVKAELQAKMEEKAGLIDRMAILSDPQVQVSLLRWCASTRPGYWLRTMSPLLTADAARSPMV